MSLPTIDNVQRPRAQGYGCRINNSYYRLFLTPDTQMSRQNAELQSPRIDDQANPEAISQDFGISFSRSDFSGGEGLRLAHLRDNPDNASSMFWDSAGLEAHSHNQEQRASLKLLTDITLIDSLISSNIHLAYDTNGERLYLSDGEDIRFTDNYNVAVPTFDTEDPHAGEGAVDVEDITFYGGELWLALGTSGLHKRDNAGTYTDVTDAAIVTPNVYKVWNIKQRVIFAHDNQLYEVLDGTGDADLRLTIESGFRFNDVYDAGDSILVSASDGHIYSIGLDEENNILTVVGRFNIAGEIPDAMTGLDALTLLTTYQPTMNDGVIGRVWLLSVSDGALANRQLIREFGTDETSHNYRIPAADTQRNHAFVGVNEEARTHLWHYDYATTGIFRHMGNEQLTGQIVDIVHIGSRVFWSIAGQGLVRQSGDNVSSGYLISPLADNFTRDKKSWSGLIVDVEGVAGNSKIDVFYTTNPDAIYTRNDPSWKRWETISNISQVGQTSFISGISSRFIAIKLEFRGDADTSPHLNSFTITASPGASDIIYELPINVSDMVTRPRYRPKTVPGLGRKIHNELKSIQGQVVTLQVLDPAETIQGTVINIAEPVIHHPLRGSPLSVALVTIRGKRIHVFGSPSISNSPGAFGIGLLGVMKTGGPE